MIHVVFQQMDVHVLKEALAIDESLAGEILEIKDDFAVGPLEDIHTEEGWRRREEWWRLLMQSSPYGKDAVGSFDDRKIAEQLKEKLKENEKEVAWIWMGQNQHDVCGYYWLISQLKEYTGRIYILYFNNLPFINEKGQLFYPTALHQIMPKEFLKAKKLCRKVTTSEMEVDPDEWNRLCRENALIRVLEGGKKISSREVSFYDEDILKVLSPEWQKGNKAMQAVLSKMKVKTGDVFLLWRMKALAEGGKLEITGEPEKGWKEFAVRLKSYAATDALINSDL